MKGRRKKPITPNSRIRAAVYRVWLYSRERHHAIKMGGNKCFNCGTTPVEVHHCHPTNWARIYQVMREELFNQNLLLVCRECHQILTDTENNKLEDYYNEPAVIIGLKAEGEK